MRPGIWYRSSHGSLCFLCCLLCASVPLWFNSASQQLLNGAPVVDDLHGPAFGSIELVFRVDAEQAVQGGAEVFRPVGVGGGPLGAGVALADHPSALDAAAAQRHGEG